MVVIFTGTESWTSHLLDFHTAAANQDSFQFSPIPQFDPGTFNFFLYDYSRVLDLKPLTADHSWSQTGGDAINIAFGNGLVVNGAGKLTQGTINVLAQFSPADTFVGELVGLNITVAAYNKVAATVSTADDAALIQAALSGNDLVGLSAKGDFFKASGGFDLVFGNGGNDTINLGAGNDAALGGTGRDTLIGEGGDDLLVGNQRADTLSGGIGHDTLDGGTQADTLTGGAGNDTFVFATGDGHDTITDFNTVQDIINISAGATAFNQLTLTAAGPDTRVSFGNVVILLEDVLKSELSAQDFRFVANISVNQLDNFADIFDTKA